MAESADQAYARWFQAAQEGNEAYIGKHLEVMSHAVDENGMTALMHAAAAGHVSCIYILLNEVRKVSNEGLTALGYAICGGFADAAMALLPHEGTMHAMPDLSPLAMSLQYKHDAIARLCIDHTDPRQDLTGNSGDEFRTLLMLTLELNDYGLMRDIIRRCHTLSADDISEAVSLEANKGPTLCVTYLIGILDALTHNSSRHGSCPTMQGPRARGVASSAGAPATTTLVMPSGGGSASFANTSATSSKPVSPRRYSPRQASPLTYGIEARKSITRVDDNGNTLLMRAVLTFNYKKMLDCAPALNGMVNKEGKTALMLAAEIGNESAASVLKRYETRAQDPAGETALILAVNKGNTKLVQMLAKYEAGLKDAAGRTALMHAVLLNKQAIVQELVKYEACHQDFQGKTALIYAVEQNVYQMCKLLMQHESGIVDFRGLRAIDYAKLFDNPEIVDLLEDKEGISREALQHILCRHGRTLRAHGGGTPRSPTASQSNTGTPVAPQKHPRTARASVSASEDVREVCAPESAFPHTSDLINAVHSSRYYDISVLAPHLANICDANGLTALHHAIHQNKRIAVCMLIPYEYESLASFKIPPGTRPEIVEMLSIYTRQGKLNVA